MSVFEAIRSRYSCRAYLDKPVEKEKLGRILEAARLAPSAKNTQDWRFVLVTDKEKKQQVANTTNRPHLFSKAAVIIAACSTSDFVMTCGQPIGPIDVAIALEHIALAATELNLATCWIGSFNAQKVKELLSIPDEVALIELMALGYPQNGRRETTREPIEKIVCREKWQF